MQMSGLEKKLRPIVEAINKGKKVTFFNGAGISTGAGIPDFRSPDTGLYANLAKLDLPFAEAVFDIDFFEENPKPFYTLAQELYPGKYAPTKFHYLIRLLQDQDSLLRVYTQNIDTLERLAGVEDDYIVEAHGSFAKNHCIKCHREMDSATLKKHMHDETVDGIPTCEVCKGYVKPDIVFFGEGLPGRFFQQWGEDCDEVEIALVAGTSLTVYPFASLPESLGKKSLRVLINKENVGDFSENRRKSDIVILEDCDQVAEELCSMLGIRDELESLVDEAKTKFGKHVSSEATVEEIEERMKEDAHLREKKEDIDITELTEKTENISLTESKSSQGEKKAKEKAQAKEEAKIKKLEDLVNKYYV
ncbi:NAD-dependent protein deacetylase HST2 [Spathaspora sp. JA1]|nr:NAD-dependent protein deacetylase HST2 [Spathaspora sp. JA1]